MDETVPTFFRRLDTSPDGSFLFAPTGSFVGRAGEAPVPTTYVFVRGVFGRPALHLPTPGEASVAVRCHPRLFALRRRGRRDGPAPGDPRPGGGKVVGSKGAGSKVAGGEAGGARPERPAPNPRDQEPEEGAEPAPLFSLPYRVVFAVATMSRVLVYDTEQRAPIACISNIHCAQITDLTWCGDGGSGGSHPAGGPSRPNGRGTGGGDTLAVTSQDGYVTLIHFARGELGEYIPRAEAPAVMRQPHASIFVQRTRARAAPRREPTDEASKDAESKDSESKDAESKDAERKGEASGGADAGARAAVAGEAPAAGAVGAAAGRRSDAGPKRKRDGDDDDDDDAGRSTGAGAPAKKQRRRVALVSGVDGTASAAGTAWAGAASAGAAVPDARSASGGQGPAAEAVDLCSEEESTSGEDVCGTDDDDFLAPEDDVAAEPASVVAETAADDEDRALRPRAPGDAPRPTPSPMNVDGASAASAPAASKKPKKRVALIACDPGTSAAAAFDF
jgi:hypothetical protein